jgi:hypothetical protein
MEHKLWKVGLIGDMMEKVKCPHCDKEFSKMGLSTHIWRTHGKGQNHKPTANKTPWNKGKHWSEDIKQKMSKANKGKKQTQDWTKEKREKKRQEMLLRYENGFEVKCGRAPKLEYDSSIAGKIKVDGSWELKVAQYLDSLNLKWERNKKRFEYINEENKLSTYCPDFYVYDWDCYIEVKGYKTKKDELKWSQFLYNIEIWNKKKLKELELI